MKKVLILGASGYVGSELFKSVNNLGGYSIKVGYQSNTLANFFIKDTTSVLKFLNFVSFCSKKIRCQSLKLNHLYRGLN